MEPRRGRRDNGLKATDYAPVGDLDPRVGEHVLELLGAQGIAAYLQPTIDVNPVTREAVVPVRPTDRLYADRAHLATVRELLRRLAVEQQEDDASGGPATGPHAGDPDGSPSPEGPAGPRGADPVGTAGVVGGRIDPAATGHPAGTGRSPDPADPRALDAVFDGIVAAFDRPVDPGEVPWPEAEELRPGETVRPVAAGDEPVRPARTVPLDAQGYVEGSLLEGLDTFGADLPDEQVPESERFEPPPPPPLPRPSRQAVFGVLAILIGLVMFLSPNGVGPVPRDDAVLIGLVAISAGAVALILRLRPTREEDPPTDDGAQV